MAVLVFDKMVGVSRNRSGRPLACVSPRLLVAMSLLTVGCDLPGRPDPADRPVPADQVLEFGVLYRQNCSGCHR